MTIARGRPRAGFSLGQMMLAVVVLAAAWVLFVELRARHADSEREERSRECVANQMSIDKLVGVWESQVRAIPTDRPVRLTLDVSGRVVEASPELTALREVPPLDSAHPGVRGLVAGSDALPAFQSGMVWNFRCPERVHEAGGHLSIPEREIHYEWLAGPQPRAELGGRKRGVRCLAAHGTPPHTP